MDELKELLKTISNQLELIDMKLSVIANNSQGPMAAGGVRYFFNPVTLPCTDSESMDEAES